MSIKLTSASTAHGRHSLALVPAGTQQAQLVARSQPHRPAVVLATNSTKGSATAPAMLPLELGTSPRTDLPPLSVPLLRALHAQAQAKGYGGMYVADANHAFERATAVSAGLHGSIIVELSVKWAEIIELGMLVGYPLDRNLVTTALDASDADFSNGALWLASSLIESVWLFGAGFVELSGARSPLRAAEIKRY